MSSSCSSTGIQFRSFPVFPIPYLWSTFTSSKQCLAFKSWISACAVMELSPTQSETKFLHRKRKKNRIHQHRSYLLPKPYPVKPPSTKLCKLETLKMSLIIPSFSHLAFKSPKSSVELLSKYRFHLFFSSSICTTRSRAVTCPFCMHLLFGFLHPFCSSSKQFSSKNLRVSVSKPSLTFCTPHSYVNLFHISTPHPVFFNPCVHIFYILDMPYPCHNTFSFSS